MYVHGSGMGSAVVDKDTGQTSKRKSLRYVFQAEESVENIKLVELLTGMEQIRLSPKTFMQAD